MDERSYWLGFSLFSGIGPGRFAKLLSHFGSAKDAWHASLSDLKESKIGEKLSVEFVGFRNTFLIETYEEDLQRKEVSYLTANDPVYPQRLLEIKNPPFVLFTKGNQEILLDDVPLGVVGTRKVTEYGRHVTERLTGELVDAGCVIVSGLAMGVDAVAHQTTLDHKGKTIAVLGCGVDCCSPQENALLYKSILEKNGVIVSEYGLSVPPNKGSFPARNRLIAGLSLGVLVTEGAADSGALITAKDAKANGRPVFAVPGPVTSSLSQGTYQLIKQGAVVVSSAKEILAELGFEGRKPRAIKTRKGDTKEEQQILDLLVREELSFDELIKRTQITSSQLGGLVSLMEMKGMIVRSAAGFFVLQD